MNRVAAAGVLMLSIACSRGGAPARTRPPAAAAAPEAPPRPAALTAPVRPSAASQALSDTFAAAAEAIRPSVVRLEVEKPSADDPDDQDQDRGAAGQVERDTGSGVIVDAAGDVLTNRHVVSGMDAVTIRLADHRSFPGRLVGEDPLTDVAVVRFEQPPPDLVCARLGHSGKLRIGEWVIAVGSPLGIDQAVTAGIVSAVGSTGPGFHFESGERVRQYIQTDAEINPGNSGGPLIDLSAEVVGINTLIGVGPGGSYGFAIPIDQAEQVARMLIADGRMRYSYLGVSAVGGDELPPELRERLGALLSGAGALVVAVEPGGPAARAGLRPGDVVTSLGDRRVESGADLIGAITDARIGELVSIDYLRDGHARSAGAVMGEYPPPERRGRRARGRR